MAAMMLMLINAHSHYFSINIIAVISWPPPLISQLFSQPMADPGWAFGENAPPPPHFVQEPAILLIKMLNFMSGQDQFIKLIKICTFY